jgi:hypothetical protein
MWAIFVPPAVHDQTLAVALPQRSSSDRLAWCSAMALDACFAWSGAPRFGVRCSLTIVGAGQPL